MGLESRDYAREDRPPGFGWSGLDGQSATKILIGINIAVWVLQVLARPIEDWLALRPDRVVQNYEVWRLVTYGFLHSVGDPLHLIFNMIGLWSFGELVESRLGRREFVGFYLVALVIAGIGHSLWVGAQHELARPAIGASGAVLAVAGACGVWFPRLPVALFGVFRMELRWLIVLWAAMDLLQIGRHIAHGAHLGGLAFGLAFGWFDWRVTGFWPRLSGAQGHSRRGRGQTLWKQMTKGLKSSPNLKVFAPPPEEDFDARVDAVLAKISQEGEASLTDAERKLLTDAAQRYKEKNSLS